MRRLLAVGVVVFGLFGGTAVYVHQAKVPAAAVQSSVTRTQALLDRAWQLPVAASFRQDLIWQSNGSLCGPASLANVFRSLGEAADTEAEVLAGTSRCWFGICPVGLTLDQLAEVAQAHTKRKVTVMRDLTPEAFHALLREANNSGRRFIINFNRESIFGAGVGHHSPIGGYLEGEDLVFVLDVNRDFQPWLVERSRLFSATDTLDGEMKRGLLLIE